MITFKVSGDYKKTERWLTSHKQLNIDEILNRYGRAGVDALKGATPVLTGKTAASWSYEIEKSGNNYTISFKNDNINRGVNIALILQYGHGTGTGGYVAGRDYINPAIAPIFDKLADDAWREITK